MKRLIVLSLILSIGTTIARADEEVENKQDTVRVTNKSNNYQSQVAQRSNITEIQRILRACSDTPYAVIDPITITPQGIKFLNPLNGELYSPIWANKSSNELPEGFPLTNFNVYVKTTQIEAGFPPFKASRYHQQLTMDYVQYQNAVVNLYGHYVPSLIGFGYRAKFQVVTKNNELDVSQIVNIPALMSLKVNNKVEIINLSVQQLGLTSPTLVNVLKKVNSSPSIDGKLEALIDYQNEVQMVLNNPNAVTKITPVLFSLQNQCSRN